MILEENVEYLYQPVLRPPQEGRGSYVPSLNFKIGHLCIEKEALVYVSYFTIAGCDGRHRCHGYNQSLCCLLPFYQCHMYSCMSLFQSQHLSNCTLTRPQYCELDFGTGKPFVNLIYEFLQELLCFCQTLNTVVHLLSRHLEVLKNDSVVPCFIESFYSYKKPWLKLKKRTLSSHELRELLFAFFHS